MCGIAGIIGNDQEEIENLKKKMMDPIHHRGPDEQLSYFDQLENVLLINTRLSILKPSILGRILSSKDDRFFITYNGEIYNSEQIKKDLEKLGHHFILTGNDTEVVLRSYEQWGPECVKKFNGMWAFAIYDRKMRQLFLSRDPTGQKPLYWSFKNKKFIFSSSLNTITLLPDFQSSIDQYSLMKFMAYNFIPAPLTLYKNIFSLKAGNSILYDLRSYNIKNFSNSILSNIYKQEAVKDISPNEICSHIENILRKNSPLYLKAEAPASLLLSGGIDSSILAYLNHGNKSLLNTVSIGFEEKSFNEAPFAKEVAENFSYHFNLYSLNLNEIKKISEKVLLKMDTPLGDPSLIPTYAAYKMSSKISKVVLGGDGADELFMGYAPYNYLSLLTRYNNLTPVFFHQFISWASSLFPGTNTYMSIKLKSQRMLRTYKNHPRFWMPLMMSSLPPREINEFLGTHYTLDEVFSEMQDCDTHNNIKRYFNFYFLNLYLPNNILTKIDRASMLNSVEGRCPFLDLELLSFLSSLSLDQVSHQKNSKYCLLKNFNQFLPPPVFKRKKHGLAIPLRKLLLQDYQKDTHILNHRFINKKYENQSKYNGGNEQFLWNLKVLKPFINKAILN